nr:ABATE domain-containing protein [Nonomuraea sp. WAC 01424]
MAGRAAAVGGHDGRRDPRELTAAKTLRQAIWEAAHARAAGDPLPAKAVATINRAAAAAPLIPELAPTAPPPDGLRRCGSRRCCRRWRGR